MILRFGSLCSGIEAASQAWEGIGFQPVFFSEIEDFPSAVLARHWPLVPNLGDMTAPDFIDRAAFWGDIDVLVGGTPCQAFSLAGLRQGLHDARGQLTLTFCEIANAADPSVVVWENVPGVLNDATNGFGYLLAGLAGHPDPLEPGPRPEQGRASTHWRWCKKTSRHTPKWSDAGYIIGPQRILAWRVLDAQYFGVAQRRARVFVVACPVASGVDPAEILFEFEGVRRDSPPSREKRQDVAGTLTGGARKDGGYSHDDAPCVECALHLTERTRGVGEAKTKVVEWSDVVPTLQSRNGGGSSDRDMVLCFGGNNTAGPIDVAPALLAQPGSGWKGDFDSETFVATCVTGDRTHALKAEGADASEDGTGRGNPIVIQHKAVKDPLAGRWYVHDSNENEAFFVPDDQLEAFLRSPDGEACCTDVTSRMQQMIALKTHRATSKDDAEIWKLAGESAVAPTLTSRQQDYDDGQTQVVAFTGDGQTADPITASEGKCYSNEGGSFRMHNVVQQPQQPVAWDTYNQDINGEVTHPIRDGNSEGTPALLYAGRVRRLTPDECEILQGMKPGHTAIPYKGKPAADGPRYKAIGNSMAVPVMRWIGRRIYAAMEKA